MSTATTIAPKTHRARRRSDARHVFLLFGAGVTGPMGKEMVGKSLPSLVRDPAALRPCGDLEYLLHAQRRE